MPAHLNLRRTGLLGLTLVFLTAFSGLELRGQTILSGTYSGGPGSITGDVSINPSTSATFTSGTTFTGANATLGNYSTLNWNQNGTLASKTITAGAAGGYAYITVGTGNSLTFDSATTVNGNIYFYSYNTGAAIINLGTINQNAGSGALFAPTLSNSGSITTSGGSTLSIGSSTYSTTNAVGGAITATGTSSTVYLQNIVNLGTLSAQLNGVLNFQGASNTPANLGTVSLASGGRALLSGTFDNTSTTISAPTGGVYELYGGTINQGTVAAGALTFTSSGGTLSGVTYTGDLTLPASSSLTFSNNVINSSFTGTNLTLGIYSTLNWNQNGTLSSKTITLGSAGNYAFINVGTGRSLTLDNATTLTGDIYLYNGNTGGTIINQGVISQNSGTGYLYAPTLTNTGTITANAGTSLYVGYYGTDATTNAAGGTLTATGTSTYVYLTNIVNLGTLYAQLNGVLNFTGASNTPANLGTVSLASGGRALLSGTFDNTSTTINAPSGGV